MACCRASTSPSTEHPTCITRMHRRGHHLLRTVPTRRRHPTSQGTTASGCRGTGHRRPTGQVRNSCRRIPARHPAMYKARAAPTWTSRPCSSTPSRPRRTMGPTRSSSSSSSRNHTDLSLASPWTPSDRPTQVVSTQSSTLLLTGLFVLTTSTATLFLPFPLHPPTPLRL